MSKLCSSCGGYGAHTAYDGEGFMESEPCTDCNGQGRIPDPDDQWICNECGHLAPAKDFEGVGGAECPHCQSVDCSEYAPTTCRACGQVVNLEDPSEEGDGADTLCAECWLKLRED